MPYCPNCGDRVDAEDGFCERCGSNVEDVGEGSVGAEESDAPGQAPADHRPWGEALSGRGQFHIYKGAVRFAIEYPVRGGWKPLVLSLGIFLVSILLVGVGGLLALPLIIPLLLLLSGYTYRLGRTAALGEAFPPEYGDWTGLLVDGLRFSVGSILFLVIFTAIIASGTALVGSFNLAFGKEIIPFGMIVGVNRILTLVAVVALPYVAFAYLTVVVGSHSPISAITDGRMVGLLTSWYFVKAFALFVGMGIATLLATVFLVTIVGLLTSVSPIGTGTAAIFLLVVGFVGVVYAHLASSAYWGYVHYQAVPRNVVPPMVGYEQSRSEDASSGVGQPSP